MPTKSRLILLFFALFWCGITSVFAAMIIPGAFRQFQTRNWPQTQGRIDESKITSNHDADGTTHGIDVSYHYTVNNHPYTSKRLFFTQMSSNDGWASKTIQQFPKDARVPVFYNPNDPADAVLIPGLTGYHLFTCMFITPFIMIGLALCFGAFFGHPKNSMGARIEDFDNITRIRPPRYMPFLAAAVAFGLASFLTLFPIAFLGGGFHPSYTAAAIGWLIVLNLTLFTFVIAYIQLHSSRYDLLLDDGQSLFTVKNKLVLPYRQITRLQLLDHPATSDNTPKQELLLHYQENDLPRQLVIKSWTNNLPAAQRFTTWLALRLNTPAQQNETLLPTAPLP